MVRNIVKVNQDNFKQEVLDSELPVLVDFWATWCMPCHMLAPIVEEIAEEWAGELKVAKLNTDESPSVAQQYGIHAIPTLIIFKNGQEVERLVGYLPKKNIEQKLKTVV